MDLIREIKSDLLEAGGHPMAAGFGFATSKLEVVKGKLLALAKERIASELLIPKLDIDAIIPFGMLTEELVTLLAEFEPFGQGNPTPIFGLRQVRVLDAFTMGRDNTHLKLVVSDPQAEGRVVPLYTVGWGLGKLASDLKAGMLVDLAGAIELNEYKGRKTIQMKLKDVTGN